MEQPELLLCIGGISDPMGAVPPCDPCCARCDLGLLVAAPAQPAHCTDLPPPPMVGSNSPRGSRRPLFRRRHLRRRNGWYKLPPLPEWDLGPPLAPPFSPTVPTKFFSPLSQRLGRSWQLSWWFDPNLHREVSEPLAVVSSSSQRWHVRLYVCSQWGKGAPGSPQGSAHPLACPSSNLGGLSLPSPPPP